MGYEINAVIAETTYKLPCRNPELTPLFFSRGRGSTRYGEAALVCRACLVRLECLTDDINGALTQVAQGDPVTGVKKTQRFGYGSRFCAYGWWVRSGGEKGYSKRVYRSFHYESCH